MQNLERETLIGAQSETTGIRKRGKQVLTSQSFRAFPKDPASADRGGEVGDGCLSQTAHAHYLGKG